MGKPKPQQSSSLNSRILIGVVGLLLSIVLHESLHIALHWNNISGVQFFTDYTTVAKITFDLPPDYDLTSEEFIAYSISAAVLIVTAIIIAKISDDTDKRTVNQILFPRSKSTKKPSIRK